ncbi:N-methyl-L-tryptophan oxidase [Streptomyces sp. NPDC051776]|uniref:N-methyl-L-tryptophan oxidase n=1 Tax=Streptomyces sp. NPDC051776 TaxID=3155414 RepID=UPI003448770F
MSTTRCDVLVVGLGVFGSATTWAVAEKGATVLAVDTHGPTHRYGSSHGESRIFRRAYREGAHYLPLLNRAHELWSELEQMHGDPLLVRSGGVFIGTTSSGVVENSRRTAEAGGVPYELWAAPELAEHFPWFTVDSGMSALYEPGAYGILATRARLAMLDAAVRRNAVLRFGTEVADVRPDRSGATVRLSSGEEISCGSVVMAAGPMMRGPLPTGLGGLLEPVRVPVYWFRPAPSVTTRGFPVFLYEAPEGGVVYGLPEWGEEGPLVKIGFHDLQHLPGEATESAAPEVPRHFRKEIEVAVARMLTGIQPEAVRWRTCFYTMTPDEDFVIDRVPGSPALVRISACSGHGFKFAPSVGECAAELALGETPGIDPARFSAARFAATPQVG